MCTMSVWLSVCLFVCRNITAVIFSSPRLSRRCRHPMQTRSQQLTNQLRVRMSRKLWRATLTFQRRETTYYMVCLSVCPSHGVSVCLSITWCVCLSITWCVCLSVCPSHGVSVCLSVHHMVCLSVHHMVCLSVCPSHGVSVCPSSL